MNFKEAKNSVKERLFSSRGHATIIAENAGVSIPVIYNALKKNSISEMTQAEKKAWECTLSYLEKEIAKEQELQDRTINVSKIIKL